MYTHPESPRPEYPRPERQRGTLEGIDWLNLNGPWQFCFDGQRRGVDERWYEEGHGPWDEQIIVPFCWESLAAWGQGDAAGDDNYYARRVFLDPSSVDDTNHRSAPRYEVGWYRREVRIPRDTAPWQGKRVILTVGAADFFTEAWCNGRPLGRHEGGYTPFEFDLTDALDEHGRGWVVFRVEDPMDNAQQPVGKQWQWYTTTSGIWQTVFVEPRALSHIGAFQIVPNIERGGSASFTIECPGASDLHEVEVVIRPPGHEPFSLRIPVHKSRAEGRIEIRPLVLWDPRHPRLYHTRLRLWSGAELVDEVRTYFGMRKISTAAQAGSDAPAALCLNDEPILLRGALHQSFYPDGVYTAGDAGVLRKDIEFAKEAGFDFLRIHIKIDDPLLLHYADTLGILLMVDFPNFGEGGDTPLGRSRFEAMMRAAVERDFNHPSIIAWCLFNETWGFGGQIELVKWMKARDLPAPKDPPDTPPPASAENEAGAEKEPAPAEAVPVPFKIANQDAHRWVHSMWQLAKQLDRTRLIEDMSVVYWEHLDYYGHVETDINSWHFYINDYEKARAHIAKVAKDTYTGSPFNYVPGFKQGSQPLITSEYGGVGALDGNRDISWSFKFLTNELRRQPKLSAYVFTQLHDVEWEYNGFLNYDRRPKDFGYDSKIANAGDVLLLDAPPVQRCALGERIQIEVESSHYARARRGSVMLHWRLSGIDGVGRVHAEIAQGGWPIAFPHRAVASAGKVEFTLPARPMLCKLTVAAIAVESGARVAENYVEFLASPGEPPAREVFDGGVILRAAPSDWARAQWSEGMNDRNDARANGRCFGAGSGFFEWLLPVDGIDFEHARLRVLCEASSRRADTPQTSLSRYPTTLDISLNGIIIYSAVVPDHPHDSRGVLSYLRGAVGAYGYMAQAVIDGDLLRRVRAAGNDPTHLRLCCSTPADSLARGGLTLYGPECGRYPLGTMVVVEY